MTCVLLRHLGWSRYGIDRATQTFQASRGLRFRLHRFSRRSTGSLVARVLSVQAPFEADEQRGTTLSSSVLDLRVRPSDPSGQPAEKPFFTCAVRGDPDPLGATMSFDGDTEYANFALFSSNATAVDLCLFKEADLIDGQITHRIPLSPEMNKTGSVWHIGLVDLDPDLLYGYSVHGPNGYNLDDGEEVPPQIAGHAFQSQRVVLDPRATAVFNGRKKYGELGPDLNYNSDGVLGYSRTWPQAAAAVPSSSRTEFDWEGDRPLGRPMEDLVIYEAHVRGFTADPSSQSDHPGTYKALTEKLDYLQSLGVNALELMPVHDFNELEYLQIDPVADSDSERYNFWGYSTVGYFSPMGRYSAKYSDESLPAAKAAEEAVNEFKTLVKEAHRRGIEIILDVVFNHTAEGNENGLTLSFRGIDNRVYYMLAPEGQCYNYSGCGNTFNCNHPVAKRFIIDCLRYWVEEMHVDGFRFDLASIMTRAHSDWHPSDPVLGSSLSSGEFITDVAGTFSDYESNEDYDLQYDDAVAPLSGGAIVNELGHMTDGAGCPTGMPLANPPLIEAISMDPVLANTKMIAEAWDCDGLNQVGAFPHYGGRWSEWNGHFRDSVRQFIKGTDGPWAGAFAAAICGSPEVYIGEPGEDDWWGNNGGRKWKGGRGPTASVNFVTAHDGFTLADLVSFNEKHNEANGEENRDGESHNLSWNCGVEGQTDDVKVLALRRRQQRNMLAALFLAHGVPMLLYGDEYGFSKEGNNNTYCHDNKLNYFDWKKAQEDSDGLLRFTRHIIALRKSRPELRRSSYVTDADIEWHGILPYEPDWSDTSRLIAFSLKGKEPGEGIYVAFNTSHEPQILTLPTWEGFEWQVLVDTSKEPPYDILAVDGRLSAEEVDAARSEMNLWTLNRSYPMLPWSCIVLESIPSNMVPKMPASKRVAESWIQKDRKQKRTKTRSKRQVKQIEE